MNVTLFLLISFLLLVGKISAQDDHETSLGCLKNYCPPNVLSDWKEALQELYDKTGGDNWMVNNGWKEFFDATNTSNFDISTLHGVSATEDGVVAIDMMYNNLVYSSDKPFGDLKIFDAFKSTLKYVDFSMNYISGSLSTAMMPKMEDVAYFDLSANMFSGEFPFSSMPASTDMLAFKIGAVPPIFGFEKGEQSDTNTTEETSSAPSMTCTGKNATCNKIVCEDMQTWSYDPYETPDPYSEGDTPVFDPTTSPCFCEEGLIFCSMQMAQTGVPTETFREYFFFHSVNNIVVEFIKSNSGIKERLIEILQGNFYFTTMLPYSMNQKSEPEMVQLYLDILLSDSYNSEQMISQGGQSRAPDPQYLLLAICSGLRDAGYSLPTMIQIYEVYAIDLMIKIFTYAEDWNALDLLEYTYYTTFDSIRSKSEEGLVRFDTEVPDAPFFFANTFTGSLACTGLSKLVYLDINKASLSGTVPQCLENMKNISFMELSDNQFSGPFPQIFADELDMTDIPGYGNDTIPSHDDDIMPYEPRLNDLIYLSARGNQITSVPLAMYTIEHSFNFDFADNNIEQHNAETLAACDATLKSMNETNNNLCVDALGCPIDTYSDSGYSEFARNFLLYNDPYSKDQFENNPDCKPCPFGTSTQNKIMQTQCKDSTPTAVTVAIVVITSVAATTVTASVATSVSTSVGTSIASSVGGSVSGSAGASVGGSSGGAGVGGGGGGGGGGGDLFSMIFVVQFISMTSQFNIPSPEQTFRTVGSGFAWANLQLWNPIKVGCTNGCYPDHPNPKNAIIAYLKSIDKSAEQAFFDNLIWICILFGLGSYLHKKISDRLCKWVDGRHEKFWQKKENEGIKSNPKPEPFTLPGPLSFPAPQVAFFLLSAQGILQTSCNMLFIPGNNSTVQVFFKFVAFGTLGGVIYTIIWLLLWVQENVGGGKRNSIDIPVKIPWTKSSITIYRVRNRIVDPEVHGGKSSRGRSASSGRNSSNSEASTSSMNQGPNQLEDNNLDNLEGGIQSCKVENRSSGNSIISLTYEHEVEEGHLTKNRMKAAIKERKLGSHGNWRSSDKRSEKILDALQDLFSKFGPSGIYFYFYLLSKKVLLALILAIFAYEGGGRVQSIILFLMMFAEGAVLFTCLPYSKIRSNVNEINLLILQATTILIPMGAIFNPPKHDGWKGIETGMMFASFMTIGYALFRQIGALCLQLWFLPGKIGTLLKGKWNKYMEKAQDAVEKTETELAVVANPLANDQGMLKLVKFVEGTAKECKPDLEAYLKEKFDHGALAFQRSYVKEKQKELKYNSGISAMIEKLKESDIFVKGIKKRRASISKDIDTNDSSLTSEDKDELIKVLAIEIMQVYIQEVLVEKIKAELQNTLFTKEPHLKVIYDSLQSKDEELRSHPLWKHGVKIMNEPIGAFVTSFLKIAVEEARKKEEDVFTEAAEFAKSNTMGGAAPAVEFDTEAQKPNEVDSSEAKEARETPPIMQNETS